MFHYGFRPDALLTDKEMVMSSSRPKRGLLSAAKALREEEHNIVAIPKNPKLHTLKKLHTRVLFDPGHVFARKLKYRGVRLLTLLNQVKTRDSRFTTALLYHNH